jgi:hypothetical protein
MILPELAADWVNFHTFCRIWGTWMRRYGGLDVCGLGGTGQWRNEQSARRYAHVVVSEESRRVELLAVPKKGPDLCEIRAKLCGPAVTT